VAKGTINADIKNRIDVCERSSLMKTRTKARPTKIRKRRKTKMEAAVSAGGRRIDALKRLLAKERADTLARVKELMREQERNGGQPPADEMDVARSLSEVETHAALFDHAQERLSAIDAAIARLGAGVYGVCARCGDEIPVARLEVIPFAQYCVDCQNEANIEARSGQSGLAKPFGGRWGGPEEISSEDSEEHLEPVRAADDDVQVDSAFGPDEEELEATGVEKRRRGRPPKAKKPAVQKKMR
jgi:RNA polymerase-binding transcription factor